MKFLLLIKKKEQKEKKYIVIGDLERVAMLEEMSGRQKSRALWLREGDKGTKKFHRVANLNRNNSIETLLGNGLVFSDHSEIKEHIVRFDNRLFTKQLSWRPKLDGLAFDSIEEEEAI
jgi:hypothetical protein